MLTDSLQLIHFKRKNESATLSHLFAQGVASSESLRSSPEFRAAAREKIAGTGKESLVDLIPAGELDPRDYEVVFGVISHRAAENWPLSLPFFSRLTLMNASRRLRLLGYRVSGMGIDAPE